ncbi:MAG: alpha/beta fold hydrolase [Chloroflexi bacterium]|nr:alpha/beta fold hydrolase [Chloroflexota bacterium]
MKFERHQGKDLQYLTVVPDDHAPDVDYPLVVMLHGFGANMQDLAGLAPAIESEGYVYACPNAPIPFELGLGQVGYGWTPPRGEATPEDIQHAERLLSEFFDEIISKFRISSGQALLMGFSQGGGMTYRCGLGRPEIFAGLVALSASLPDPDELRGRLPQKRKQPIFIAHGRADPMVSMESARNTRKFLEEEGYSPDYHEYDMGHEIPLPVLQDLIPWMTGLLPPYRSNLA